MSIIISYISHTHKDNVSSLPGSSGNGPVRAVETKGTKGPNLSRTTWHLFELCQLVFTTAKSDSWGNLCCYSFKAESSSAFAKLTNIESWDQAVDKFPAFATDDQLNRFLGIDIRKTIPKAFCQQLTTHHQFPVLSSMVHCECCAL